MQMSKFNAAQPITNVLGIILKIFFIFPQKAVTAGYLGNGLDIAPNFSGTIFGLANTLSSMSGYFSSLMIGELTTEKVWNRSNVLLDYSEDKRKVKELKFKRHFGPLIRERL